LLGMWTTFFLIRNTLYMEIMSDEVNDLLALIFH